MLESQGRLQEAEQVIGQGVEFQPNSTVLRANLAANLAKQNRFEEAYELSSFIYEQVPGDDLSRYAMLRYLRIQASIRQVSQKMLDHGRFTFAPGAYKQPDALPQEVPQSWNDLLQHTELYDED